MTQVSESKVFIKKLKIVNFKCYKGAFTLELSEGLNILVGDNEAGKSTILEAIHLALSGLIGGRYIKTELTQYLFNNEVVIEYLENLKNSRPAPLPYIHIEIYLAGDDLAFFEGNENSENTKFEGVSLKIEFDEEKYKAEYEALLSAGEVKTIPIEYYDLNWTAFSRNNITPKVIPLKSALIDSASTRNQNGSDIYISRIVRDLLNESDVVQVLQAHRKMKESFGENEAIITINSKLDAAVEISNKAVKLSVDLSSKNAWENSLMTYLDNVPFQNVGKGEQCIVKTKLALSHKKTKNASLILLEEPENHLSHSKLNQLIQDIKTKCGNKQIILSTHSSFVANKLGLKSLIFLNNSQTIRLNDLSPDTKAFFEKLSGYDTLRLILCKKAILVEGDSDELVVQKAYLKKHGKLPIEDNIDVISVGTSFLRFLEIAEKINKPISVVTDNDGKVADLKNKYANYLAPNTKPNIKIHFDEVEDTGSLKINDKPFNYNTLEPKIVKANNLEKINTILSTSYKDLDELHKYMKKNKTECALKIFDTNIDFTFPDYILQSIE